MIGLYKYGNESFDSCLCRQQRLARPILKQLFLEKRGSHLRLVKMDNDFQVSWPVVALGDACVCCQL